MEDSAAYLLGHDPIEWDRLQEQHVLWAPSLLGDLSAAGVGSGVRILEVGCGTGELLADLVERNAGGHTVGLELDPAAAAFTRNRLDGRATIIEGDLLTTDLGGPYDLIVARWVLSFLPDADRALARMAGALAPGGLLAVQDYNHDGLGIWPRHPAFDRVIEGYRAAYRQRGGDLWIAARLAGVFHDLGLNEIRTVPHVKAGDPSTSTWRWVSRFLLEHLHTLVDGGQLSIDEAEAFRIAFAARATDPRAVLFTPLQVTVLGRRPAADPRTLDGRQTTR